MGKRQRKMSASSSPAKAAANGLEPRFSLPPSTPLSSKRSLIIGGVQIYIYGLDELKQPSGVEVAVLYLAHNRTRTYLVTEGIAHEILHRYRTDGREKRMEMIAVTMNMRNHGDREVRFWTASFTIPYYSRDRSFICLLHLNRSAGRQTSLGATAMKITGMIYILLSSILHVLNHGSSFSCYIP